MIKNSSIYISAKKDYEKAKEYIQGKRDNLEDYIKKIINEQLKVTTIENIKRATKENLFHISFIAFDGNDFYDSHYGKNSYYHAMAIREGQTLSSDSYSNKKFMGELTKLKSEIKKQHNNSYTCWRKLGILLHMIVDLHTKSHAYITGNSDKVTIHHHFDYLMQDSSLHSEADKNPNIKNSIDILNKFMTTNDINEGTNNTVIGYSPIKNHPNISYYYNT